MRFLKKVVLTVAAHEPQDSAALGSKEKNP